MFGLKSKRQTKKLKKNTMGRRLVTVGDSKSLFSEQFRTIRTNIKFSVPDTALNTILVTSSIPGEGKSTNAANLGVVFAQEGKKVLIVDADMRKPTLHYTFGISNRIGLSSVLSSQGISQEAIQETPIIGLSILPAGPHPPNPAELLSSISFDTFLEEMKQTFDIIIFDAPPILTVSDSQILSNKCDGTLFIIHSGVVDKEEVKKAQKTLSASQAKVLGAVLNNCKISRKTKYYDHYFDRKL
jgi:protein-tyrosine kinase